MSVPDVTCQQLYGHQCLGYMEKAAPGLPFSWQYKKRPYPGCLSNRNHNDSGRSILYKCMQYMHKLSHKSITTLRLACIV